MKILPAISNWIAKRFNLRQPPGWFIDWVGGAESTTGVRVGHQMALEYAPFWAAVRIISGTVASLPFKVYERRADGGKIARTDHRVYRLLHDRPNEYMDAVTFLETRQAHVLCYGNAFAEIQRDGAGRAVGLWPLLPNRTQRKVMPDGTLYYEVRIGDTGQTVQLADEDVLHIKGLGFDGYTGYDVVRYHREALGYGIAVKEFGSRFYANDANPGGVLECPNALSDTAFRRLKESWNESHTGLSHSHRMQILEEGTKWTKIGVDPKDAQAIEVQKFTIDDCARIFQIPPHKLGSMEFSKYNNIEQLQIDFICTTMLYWFRKWEQEVNYKLFGPAERDRFFAEILADAALRGNTEARTAFYAGGRQWGYLSINDIRSKENMNPIGPAGDVYLDPLNMAPAGSLLDPSASPAADSPNDEPPSDGPDGPEDPVRAAHRGLLIAQCRRIVTKQVRATAGKVQTDSWWIRHQKWVMALIGPMMHACSRAAYGGMDTSVLLDDILRTWFSDSSQLEIGDEERIADDILSRIGGCHALSQ